jgi:hypothetical protein
MEYKMEFTIQINPIDKEMFEGDMDRLRHILEDDIENYGAGYDKQMGGDGKIEVRSCFRLVKRKKQ